MKHFKIFTLIIFLLFFSKKVYSQSDISMRLGMSIPVSNFASPDIFSENAGGAKSGFSAGLQYEYSQVDNDFGLYTGIDFSHHKLKEEAISLVNSNFIAGSTIRFHTYTNIPVSAGCKYTFAEESAVGISLNGGIVLNFLKISEIVNGRNNQVEKAKYNLLTNLGMKAGVDIIFSDKNIFLSIDFYSIGKYNVEDNINTFSNANRFVNSSKVDLLTIRFGFNILNKQINND